MPRRAGKPPAGRRGPGDSEAVLDVLRERGRRNLPCDELYRQLFNPNLYLPAYGRIYANQGAMTPGACGETADGMSEAKIGRIIEALRHERYRFRPVRRVHIPKPNGKTRPLGLPSWSDKLVGEVIRLLLEAYYEPRFSARSHGFRPGRGCHTALSDLAHNWTGTTWFIEGDISDCFGSLDHKVLLAILSEKIHDNRILRLIQQMLKAGYLEDWKWHATLSGSPQGGVLSPLLSNIYMDRLDKFVETVLIPECTRGATRRRNPAYQKLDNAIGNTRKRLRRRKEHTETAQVRQWRKELRRLPSGDPQDPGYRRLRYLRYADDHILGFIGPKAEAETIKQRLAEFLHDDLKLELNQDKTLITHGRTQSARFLGYEISVQHADAKITRSSRINRGRRTINGKIKLCVPKDVIKAKCAPFLRRGKPAHLPQLASCTPFDIVRIYGAQYRGIPLTRQRKAVIDDLPSTPFTPRSRPRGSQLIDRLRRGWCELCDRRTQVQVHQIRHLAELQAWKEQPAWVQLMVKKRRRTLVVCPPCHQGIHA
ncbi:reverse transcriptase/maturase family protein [Streptomyces sp. JW3]|uniref:reverse transcriptase/maturase family protein n=1 Tax=Streptomyces sp. JW3 TaxID=3456955 RepID=UPI003FA44803